MTFTTRCVFSHSTVQTNERNEPRKKCALNMHFVSQLPCTGRLLLIHLFVPKKNSFRDRADHWPTLFLISKSVNTIEIYISTLPQSRGSWQILALYQNKDQLQNYIPPQNSSAAFRQFFRKKLEVKCIKNKDLKEQQPPTKRSWSPLPQRALNWSMFWRIKMLARLLPSLDHNVQLTRLSSPVDLFL